MSGPTDRNRLESEASPYLQQHADNPVNWQPWDDAALEAARERDVPIFLSVGYAACHWCHVMEEESFEDPAVAEALNENFVPIKVDREERPDLDSVYQTACQMMSGRGGWPLSAWLTPEGEPFYVGTYFPRESRQGMPGFLDLLDDVADSWADPEERAEFEQRAATVTTRIRGELEETGEEPSAAQGAGAEPDAAVGDGAAAETGPSPVERAASAALRNADREHGGWGQGPKFPQPARIEALFDAGAGDPSGGAADAGTSEGSGDAGAGDGSGDSENGNADDEGTASEFHAVANAALAAMVDGGLYDHVGGGFHRYCTDRDWTVPHFEKMLYDNAELPRSLLAGHQLTGHDRYATVARETFAFLDRELAHPDGSISATLDARSAVPTNRTADGEPGEHEEGEFYVWTPAEVADALDDPELSELVCDRYGITDRGNFEGATVLTIDTSIETLAETYDLAPATVRKRLDDARETLRRVRESRPRPRRDDKVIAAWNGLAIRALAAGSIVLEDDELVKRASTALDAVRTQLWDGEQLARRYVPGDAGGGDAEESSSVDVQGRGYLEDYAFLGRGALACYEATGDVDALAFALDLGERIVGQFYDETSETLYTTPAGGEDLIARPQEPRDQSTPSSLAVGTDLLLALDAFRTDDRFDEVARAVLATHESRLEKRPLEHPSLALAAERARAGSTEVTLAIDGLGASGESSTLNGSPDGAVGLSDAWRSWLADRYLPRRLLAPRPATAEGLAAWLDRLDLDEAPPIWAGREAGDGGSQSGDSTGFAEGPTAYVCRGFTCSRPLTDPAAADEWLDG
ncbi:thioredoxin domain-containing protein [Salinarchaeum laminariae]|uniref:thioredoxin domain-containing protein n=1 Tax=Salinarchaeum laminariae TaxID=869888 RepID=UPI0020BD708B|nr:thioredoxin domain-containing protein [Salinarchaeum laminariae]